MKRKLSEADKYDLKQHGFKKDGNTTLGSNLGAYGSTLQSLLIAYKQDSQNSLIIKRLQELGYGHLIS